MKNNSYQIFKLFVILKNEKYSFSKKIIEKLSNQTYFLKFSNNKIQLKVSNLKLYLY